MTAVFAALRLYRAAMAGCIAVACLVFWTRHRFWLPRYVHVMAAIAATAGVGTVVAVQAVAPSTTSGRPMQAALVVLLMPAIVYAVFIVYGGQRAAYRSAARVCEACGAEALPRKRSDGPMDPRCPRCGAPTGPTPVA